MSDLYARLIAALPAVRDLESQGCRVIGCTCDMDTAVLRIDPPPPVLSDTWSWSWVAPAAHLRETPACCRHTRADGIAVEWYPVRRPGLRPTVAPVPHRQPRRPAGTSPEAA